MVVRSEMVALLTVKSAIATPLVNSSKVMETGIEVVLVGPVVSKAVTTGPSTS